MAHIKTVILTSTPHKTLERIMKCFREGKDPQGNSLEGWKAYLELEDVNDCVKLLYGTLLVYEVDGEEKRTCILLKAYGKDKEDKDLPQAEKSEEVESAVQKERYIGVSAHFWTPYNEKFRPSVKERENILLRFDELMNVHFPTLFDELIPRNETII